MKNRFGEVGIANNGQKMTIIEYFGSQNITVMFEDKTIVTGKAYSCFKKGTIRNPNFTKQPKRVGESVRANNGQIMTIVDYNEFNSLLSVQFEDGTIVNGVNKNSFYRGSVRNPNYNPSSKSHLFEVGYNKKGEKMTIIAWFKYENISVQFEDGTIRTNCHYCNFKAGNISKVNPENRKISSKLKTERIGERAVNNRGLEMMILDYRQNKDIDVLFLKDGYIAKNRDYHHFKDGRIYNPNFRCCD